jgi:hypothetical protein
MFMLVRLTQPENAPLPILVTLLGMMILVTGIPANQPDPIASNPSTKVMLVRLVQPVNAPLPILVTLLPTVTLARLVQPEKAPLWRIGSGKSVIGGAIIEFNVTKGDIAVTLSSLRVPTEPLLMVTLPP